MKLSVLDLFSGIGGFSLGLEATGGFETIAFCEIDKKCRQVLDKHWPNVHKFEDIKQIKGEDIGTVDVVCGGFPCQDISVAGKGKGLSGERSGLWFEMLRIIKETKPKYVIAENVPALRNRGLDEVLRGFAEIGYDAEWHCVPASAIGAPHRRDRIWIIAYPNSTRSQTQGAKFQATGVEQYGKLGSDLVMGYSGGDNEGIRHNTDKKMFGRWNATQTQERGEYTDTPCRSGVGQEVMANTHNIRRSGSENSKGDREGDDGDEKRQSRSSEPEGSSILGAFFYRGEDGDRQWENPQGFWKTEPNVGRVVDGFPGRVDRIKQLGNAIVPQIAMIIGNAMMEARK